MMISDAVKVLAVRAQAAPMVAEAMGVSIPRLWQLVHHAIDDPAVAAEAPMETSRLRRLRDQRRAARSGRVDP